MGTIEAPDANSALKMLPADADPSSGVMGGLSGTGTPAPNAGPTLPQGGGTPGLPDTASTGNNLLDFKNMLSTIDAAAKQNRNAFVPGLASSVPAGTLNASSFGDIVQMLNRGTDTFRSETNKNAMDAFNASKPTFDTFTMDNNLYQVQKDATGQIIGKPTLIQAGVPKETTTDKTLDPLDVARYLDLYPDSGVTTSDTKATADAKALKSTSPEVVNEKLVTSYQTANPGSTYEDAVTEINNSKTIADKAGAIAAAQKVYGSQPSETAPEVINASNINQYKVENGKLVPDTNYVPPPTDRIEKYTPTVIDQIGSFFSGMF